MVRAIHAVTPPQPDPHRSCIVTLASASLGTVLPWTGFTQVHNIPSPLSRWRVKQNGRLSKAAHTSPALSSPLRACLRASSLRHPGRPLHAAGVTGVPTHLAEFRESARKERACKHFIVFYFIVSTMCRLKVWFQFPRHGCRGTAHITKNLLLLFLLFVLY